MQHHPTSVLQRLCPVTTGIELARKLKLVECLWLSLVERERGVETSTVTHPSWIMWHFDGKHRPETHYLDRYSDLL